MTKDDQKKLAWGAAFAAALLFFANAKSKGFGSRSKPTEQLSHTLQFQPGMAHVCSWDGGPFRDCVDTLSKIPMAKGVETATIYPNGAAHGSVETAIDTLEAIGYDVSVVELSPPPGPDQTQTPPPPPGSGLPSEEGPEGDGDDFPGAPSKPGNPEFPGAPTKPGNGTGTAEPSGGLEPEEPGEVGSSGGGPRRFRS